MKKLFTRAACAAVVFAGLRCLGATTYTYDDGTLTWSYTTSSGKATLTGVTANNSGEITGTLTIPSTVDDATVDSIGENFCKGAALSAVVFPNTLKTINYGAFANCTALESLTLPDSLTAIGGTGYSSGRTGAFNGCTALKSVAFGSGLVTIGDGFGSSRDDNPDYYAYTAPCVL